jgi:integrase
MGTIYSYQSTAGKRYRIVYRTPERKQTSKRGFRTKREAEQFLAIVEVSKLRGEWIDSTRSRVSVAELASEWYSAQVQIKPTTLSGYRHSLDKHVLPKWGNYLLTAVNHGDVQQWVQDLGQTLGPSMVRQVHLVLAGIMKYAIRDGRLMKSPCDDIQLPRILKKRHGYLTHKQVRALASECGDYGHIVLFQSYTGLRWGEMAALTVQRIDLVKRRVEVADAVSEPRGVLTWGTPKNHVRRSVPFPEFLVPVLKLQMTGLSAADVVFKGSDGGVMRSGNFRNRVFNEAVKRAMKLDPSFPRVTVHDLRHTAASLAVSAGANVKAVQRMLGHASAAMTLDVYADLFDDDLDAVAIALNKDALK